MTLRKSGLVGAALLLGTAALAHAQVPYQPYPYTAVPTSPSSWSYDPYTSGLSPCPQYLPGDLGKCGDRMPATYGQPNYAEHIYPQPGYYPPAYYPPGYYSPSYPTPIR
jgi:hypothetical protein